MTRVPEGMYTNAARKKAAPKTTKPTSVQPWIDKTHFGRKSGGIPCWITAVSHPDSTETHPAKAWAIKPINNMAKATQILPNASAG